MSEETVEFTPEEKFRLKLENMTFVDLHALFIFVSGDFNKQFGGKVETKKLIHERYHMVLNELNKRVYGGNPYELETVKFEGDKPENIDLSKFEKGNE